MSGQNLLQISQQERSISMNIEYLVELRFSLPGENTEEVLKRVHLIMKGESFPIAIYSVAVNPVSVDKRIERLDS